MGYRRGQEKAVLSKAHHAKEARGSVQSQQQKLGDVSEQLFEDTKQRKYKELYGRLTAIDPDKKLRAGTLQLGVLEEELVEFLRPMVAYLQETSGCLEFESFASALDYQRAHSATPTAHLFVARSSTRTSEMYRQALQEVAFTPRTDERSNRIAARHRPRGAPLHEQLLREKEIWDSKLQEQRTRQEEEQLRECTFQPNSRRSHSVCLSACRRSGSLTPRMGDDFAQTSEIATAIVPLEPLAVASAGNCSLVDALLAWLR